MLASPPYRRIQSPCDSTATCAAPRSPSAFVNQRPSAGATCKTDARDGVTAAITDPIGLASIRERRFTDAEERQVLQRARAIAIVIVEALGHADAR